MSHRIGRVSHIIRDVVSDAIAHRLSDPRVCKWTSVTRVELTADMRIADVYLSVMGDDVTARTTMQGMESARGMIQTRLAKQLSMRQCPMLRLRLDRGIKAAAEIYRTLDEIAKERTPDGARPDHADIAPDGKPDDPRSMPGDGV